MPQSSAFGGMYAMLEATGFTPGAVRSVSMFTARTECVVYPVSTTSSHDVPGTSSAPSGKLPGKSVKSHSLPAGSSLRPSGSTTGVPDAFVFSSAVPVGVVATHCPCTGAG